MNHFTLEGFGSFGHDPANIISRTVGGSPATISDYNTECTEPLNNL